jgi:hypothetical protein
LFIAVVVVGCGEPAKPPIEIKGPVTTANQPAKLPLSPPNFDSQSRLALVRRTGEVRVGMGYEDARMIFADPPGSYEKTDLPPSVTEPYDARGWQTKNEGFGAILYHGRVAAAVYELAKASEDRVQEWVQAEQDRLGVPSSVISGKHVRYWFWQSGTRQAPGDQMVMICATEMPPTRLSLTAAIGTSTIMQALGMTPEAAAGDKPNADLMIDRLQSGKN